MRDGPRRGMGRPVLYAKAEPPYPDRLGHAFHNLPAEEAWVRLAFLLPPADHVPPIGLLVGARVQKSLEVQAMLLQRKSIYDTVLPETARTSPAWHLPAVTSQLGVCQRRPGGEP